MTLDDLERPKRQSCLNKTLKVLRSQPEKISTKDDCGSIKGTGVLVEEGTEHYLSWWWIRDKLNHWERRNTPHL